VLITSSLTLASPTYTYTQLTTYRQLSIGQSFTVSESCEDSFTITHMGLTGRVSDT